MTSPADQIAHPDPTTAQPSQEERARRRSARRRRQVFIWTPILALLAAGTAYAGWSYFKSAHQPFTGPTWEVKKERLQVAIVERGALESADNSDIVCRVKAGKKGTSGIIKWVIDDGTEVVKDQKLIDIDDSALQEDLKDQTNNVNKAKADWITAKENYLITESQNFSDIESAKTTKNLAEIDLKKFLGDNLAARVLPIKTRDELQAYLLSGLEGELTKQLELPGNKSISDILQTMSDIEGRIELARSDREMALDRAAWSQRMVKKGYLSRSQADSDRSKLDGTQFTLKKTQVEFDLFRKYTIEKSVTELWSKVKEADRALHRVTSQAIAKLNTSQADLDSKHATYLQQVDRKNDVEQEIAKCSIYSPQKGLVVYYVPEQARFGSGSQQSTVAQGEPVREGQKLMRIPNLARMLVNTRVHEAMVTKLKGEISLPLGFTATLHGTLSINCDSWSAAIANVVLAENKEQFREHDFEIIYPGQRAYVRIDAFPTKIHEGRVKNVATVASQADWMSSDVKVYQTMISIDESVSNLKPGMSAEVTILAEETSEPVLTIPIQAVAGSIAMGAKRKCFVIVDGQPKERDILVGRSNDKSVEVKEGLEENDKVVLNPRSLLGDKSGMRVGTPATRRGVDGDEVGPSGGGKKGKKGFPQGGPGAGIPGAAPGAPGAFAPGGAPNAPSGAGKQFNRPEAAPERKS